jgi:hypothetical protein
MTNDPTPPREPKRHPSGRPIRVTFVTSDDDIPDPVSILTGANLRPESERFRPPPKESEDANE